MKTMVRALAGLALVLMLQSAAYAANIYYEEGDAGNGSTTPAQVTLGPNAPLDAIRGKLTAGDVDAFVINIYDPANFSAKTSDVNPAFGPLALFDTQLFLFELDGSPLVANDDVNASNKLSDLPKGAVPGLTAGFYIVAIAGWDEDPDYNQMFPGGGTAVVKPNLNIGALATWGFEPFSDYGKYTIQFTGAMCVEICEENPVEEPIPEPATLALLTLGLVGLGIRRRNA